MPPPSPEDIWDMYGSSLSQRGMSGDKYIVDANTEFRFQLGLGGNVAWIEYAIGDEFSVKRKIGPLPSGQRYIDIADAPPEQFPSDHGVKLSIYCDPSGFMEIEACGGCPETLVPARNLVSVLLQNTQSIVSLSTNTWFINLNKSFSYRD